MSWFASLFGGNTNKNARKGQAMSSTHEAFALPTSSPGFHQHPDAFNPDNFNTPDPESAGSFTYPPQSPAGAYGYIPTNSNSRHNSLLPMHNMPGSSRGQYPPLEQTWNRLRVWLGREYPELGDTLNWGILPLDLADLEMQFGFALPQTIRESYLVVDGQEAESAAGCAEGLFFGLIFLPLEEVLGEWRFWRDVDDDPATGANERLREGMRSVPPDYIRKEYSQKGWIPLISDKGGNYIGVDINPDEKGAAGQVIVFGRDFDTKVVLWRGDGPHGWASWLANFVEELETGEGFEVGRGDESEDGSEDDIGYESYYHDGTGKGQGDGGGVSGGGTGLKLTGEYRGWNVLEAWADRSLRRWYEAGAIPETALEPPPEKAPNPLEYGDAQGLTGQGSAAEVMIPVLDERGASAPYADNAELRGPVPTISVTKPPTPLPVDVPTAQEISSLPSPPESRHSSFDQDLESGMASRPHTPATRRGIASETEAAAQMSPTVTESSRLVGSFEPPPSPSPRQPNLLEDDVPLIDTSPLVDTTTTAPEPVVEALKVEPEAAVESKVESESEAESESESEDEEPSQPIRLVGGGGISGVVTNEPEPEPIEEETVEQEPDVPDTASVTSTKKHEKKKSVVVAGLKKLGGMRKKDKDTTA